MVIQFRATINISINGSPQTDMQQDLISVMVDSNMHLPAMLTVELFDDDLTWVNKTDIDLGKPVEVKFSEQDDTDSTETPLTKVLFQGEDTLGNFQLWETDGTATGTVKVASLGSGGLMPNTIAAPF